MTEDYGKCLEYTRYDFNKSVVQRRSSVLSHAQALEISWSIADIGRGALSVSVHWPFEVTLSA